MNLPEFSDGRLTALSVCCPTDTPNGLAANYQADRFDEDAHYGDGHWFRLLIGKSRTDDPDSVHFHVDTVKQLAKSPPGSSDLDTLIERASDFFGSESLALARGRYEIDEDSLPQDGIVRAFLKITTETGGEELFVDGMSFFFKGEDFDQIKWKQLPEDRIRVDICAFIPLTIGSEMLTKAESYLGTGINRFLLGGDDDEQTGTGF